MKFLNNLLMFGVLVLSSSGHVNLKKLLQSFDKVTEYMMGNSKMLSMSSFFGIERAKALLLNLNIDRLTKDEYSRLMLALEHVDGILLSKNRKLINSEEWVSHITNYSFWKKKISYKRLHGEYQYVDRIPAKQILYQLFNEAETACITPEMFKFCMNDLFDYARKSSIPRKKQRVNESCKYFMWNNYAGIGYETTHRVLYIQVLQGLLNNNLLESNIHTLCSHILNQILTTSGNNLLFDLFLEQNFICGVQGLMEFLNPKWINFILNNQLSEGCFPLFGQNNISLPVFTRGRCSEHATGVAAAWLALEIHFIVTSRSSPNL